MNDEEKWKKAKIYFYQGNAYYANGEYDKAIEVYNKAIELKSDYAEAYNNLGIAYYNNGEYDKAIEAYNKAIELKPDDANAYYNLGIAYFNKSEYDKAIEAYNEAIRLNPNLAEAYNNLGIAYYDKGEYDKAVKAYNEAIGLYPDYAYVYNNLGNAYGQKGEYDRVKAIKAYNEAIELYPDYAYAYNNLGNAYGQKGEYDKAIEAFNKAIKFKLDYATAYNNLGDVYKNKGEYDKAIEAYNTAFDLKPDDDYFNHTIDSNDENRDVYKKIYQSSYVIMRLLHINNNKETKYGFAHYTFKSIAEKLLIKEKKKKDDKDKGEDKGEGEVSPLRLSSIRTSNDPMEGLVVFKYLGLENKETKMDYQAFVACFTFDAECLNQFRLYGKEQGQEATGVSLVFKKDFFAEEPAGMAPEHVMDKPDNKPDIRIEKKPSKEKYSLYRCVYTDPKTKQIIALGHKDDYAFFRDEPDTDSGEIQKKIKDYKEKINTNLQTVREEFDKLKDFIKTNDGKINLQLVCDLLIHIRYLVKHIAFKEEQECRIVKVEALSNHDKVKLKDDKMFIDTCSIVDFVDRIYFAPNAVGMEFFQEKLVYDGSKHITCYQCTHPIRTQKA